MTAYYVDSISGNDEFPGNSDLWPWRTSGKIATVSIFPGDVIRFKRGGEYKRLVIPSGGKEGAFIKVASYGYGPKPFINPDDSEDNAVYSEFPFVEITELSVRTPRKQKADGIKMVGENPAVAFCDIAGNSQTPERVRAIYIWGSNPLIRHNTIRYTTSGIDIIGRNGGFPGLIEHNQISELNSGDAGEGDGIVVQTPNGVPRDYSGLIIRKNDISGFMEDGIDLWRTSGVVVEHNFVHDSDYLDINGIKSMGDDLTGLGNIIRHNHIENIGNVKTGKGIGIACRRGTHDIYRNIVINIVDRGITAWEGEKKCTLNIYENILAHMRICIFIPAGITYREDDNLMISTETDVYAE